MTGRYEIGWHSSDIDVCHVAYALEDGSREDLFDVQLYTVDSGNEQDGARVESLEALELLVSRANQAEQNRDELGYVLAAMAYFAPNRSVCVEPFARAFLRACELLEERGIKPSRNELVEWVGKWPKP